MKQQQLQREWAKALRERPVEVRIVDPKQFGRLRSIGRPPRQNDTIDAIVPGSPDLNEARASHDAAPAASSDGDARPALKDTAIQLGEPGRACGAAAVQRSRPDIEDDRRRIRHDRGRDLGLDPGHATFTELAQIIESVRKSAAPPSAALIAALPNSAGPTTDRRLLVGSLPSMTIVADVEANGTSRAARDPRRVLYGLPWGATRRDPVLKAFTTAWWRREN